MSDSAIFWFRSQLFQHFISLLYFNSVIVAYDRQHKGRIQEIEGWDDGGNLNHLITLALYHHTPRNASGSNYSHWGS